MNRPLVAPRVSAGCVCTVCACLCDDLTVIGAADGTLTGVAGACTKGLAGLTAAAFPPALPPDDGRAVLPGESLIASLAPVAATLRAAGRVLFYGLARNTTQAQRAAIGLADALGGAIDVEGPAASAGLAQVGISTCTWGEIRQRCDLLVQWDLDLTNVAPRFLERFYAPPAGRTLVRFRFVDPAESTPPEPLPEGFTAEQVTDVRLRPGCGNEALHVVRTLLRGGSPDAGDVLDRTGVPLADWQAFVARLQEAAYAAWVWEPQHFAEVPRHHETLLELIREVQKTVRCVGLPLGRGGNATGAEDALTSAAGFPRAIDFSLGRPQSCGSTYSAPSLLRRGEVGAVVILGADPLGEEHFPADVAERLRSMPLIVLDDRTTATTRAATHLLPTARFELGTAGTIHRADEVSLPLAAVLVDPRPTAEAWLKALAAALDVAWALPPEPLPREVVPCRTPA